ncbi:ABC transporter permease [Streptomyces sp. NPDC020883]|uniref:ABC transporter permease n=1 Tax=unclassified Streptomyces TaxID=2593676 RepID=UPI003318A2B8
MTAAQTPHENQPPEEPHRHPSAPGGAPGDSAGPDSGAPAASESTAPGDSAGGPEFARELREGVLIALAVAVSGVLLGVLWAWLAPRVPLIADTHNVYLKNTEGEEAIGADGTFFLLAFGFGVVTAAVVFLLRRRGGIPLVVSLAVGGLLGAVLGWLTGMWLGPTPDVVAHAKQVGAGVVFDGPLRLQAKGALLAWPIAGMIIQIALTGLFGPRDPEPDTLMVPDWSGHHQQPPTGD